MIRTLALALGALACVSMVILGILIMWPVPAPDPERSFDFTRVEMPPEARPDTTFEARDGAALPLRVYAAGGADTAVIVLHGSAGYGDYLHPLAAHLSDNDMAHVYVPDLRGHGDDPSRRGDIAYFDQLADDVADLVARVRADVPGARVVLAGHSAGGGLALRVAGGEYAEQVDALLLIAPYLGHDAPTAIGDAGGWAHPRLPRMVALQVLNNFGIRLLNGLEVISFNLPEAYRTGRETLGYSWRMVHGFAPRDYVSDLQGVNVPLLVAVGERDEAFIAERFAPVIGEYAPHGDVVVLPAIAHMDVVADRLALDLFAQWVVGLDDERSR